jgi:hypothetical protein
MLLKNGTVSSMRKGQAASLEERLKQSLARRWESIVAKCHPAIFELAGTWKESIEALQALGANRPVDLISKIETHMEEELAKIHRKYSGPVQPPPGKFATQTIFSDSALVSETDEQGVTEYVHFGRHKVPWKEDLEAISKRDYAASKRVQRTLGDLEKLRCAKGPIQPFKGDLEHSSIFQLLWGFGIELLTREELADFLDAFCPCGNQGHDSDALKKQRNRFAKTLSHNSRKDR